MSTEAIITTLISIIVAIWLGSLQIKAMAASDPTQYDPHAKLKWAGRFFFTFIRRFGLPLSTFALSLFILVNEQAFAIPASITLSVSTSWLLLVIVNDRTLRFMISQWERIDELKKEIAELKSKGSNNPYDNPLFRDKNS